MTDIIVIVVGSLLGVGVLAYFVGFGRGVRFADERRRQGGAK